MLAVAVCGGLWGGGALSAGEEDHSVAAERDLVIPRGVQNS